MLQSMHRDRCKSIVRWVHADGAPRHRWKRHIRENERVILLSLEEFDSVI
jgi:hypothetical protein